MAAASGFVSVRRSAARSARARRSHAAAGAPSRPGPSPSVTTRTIEAGAAGTSGGSKKAARSHPTRSFACASRRLKEARSAREPATLAQAGTINRPCLSGTTPTTEVVGAATLGRSSPALLPALATAESASRRLKEAPSARAAATAAVDGPPTTTPLGPRPSEMTLTTDPEDAPTSGTLNANELQSTPCCTVLGTGLRSLQTAISYGYVFAVVVFNLQRHARTPI